MTMMSWWASDRPPKAPMRSSSCCLASIAASGVEADTSAGSRVTAADSSASKETSSVRRVRRNWSMQALRAIS